MTTTPTVSVIIPCFNAAATVADAVESVAAQDVDYEIILVDDGSTDDTAAVIKEMLNHFSTRIVAISQTNQGAAAARNRGIQLARGNYLCFLDADDQYKPGFFAAARQVLDQQASVIAVECRLELSHTDRTPEPWQLEAMEATMPGTLMVRAEIVRLMGGFPDDRAFRGEVAGEDGCFRLQLPAFGDIYKLNAVGLRYSLRPGSHADLFLQRATRENGRVVFNYQSAEERDGSFALAIQRYRESIGSRMVERACEQIRTEVAAGANLETCRKSLLPGTPGNGTVEGFALYTLAKRWPVAGDVLELSASQQFQSTHWLAAGCASSRNGKVTSNAADARQTVKAVCANIATLPLAPIMRLAEDRLPRGGLLILYSDQRPLPEGLGLTAGWKEKLRLPWLQALEKV